MLSVIIPTFNEKAVLQKCIISLGEQSYLDFEIIIVDDGSIDNTKDIVENLKSQISNLKFLTQTHKGAGAARNLGASAAKGGILVFVDADMTFDAKFLEALTLPVRNKISKGTFSKEEYVSNWKNVWAKCWSINENWEPGRRHPKIYPNSQPVFRAILKSEFDKVGGFTPGGYDDDWSLYKKLGYMAEEAPGAIFYHKNPDSLPEIFNHAKWVGKRSYKFGVFGSLIGLVRASFPISIIVGLFKAIINLQPAFLVFKIVYDLGIFFGIAEMLLSGRVSK